ncbi:DUF542 domain-containing protein [Ensifer psoraleae]|uniref:DUF542 domain-containing protein n=1 Tax=Sinorhizobium psoraleae TaxID=520838 RepID=A0ABT4KDA1_9HYPH|nr:DUF542 domain-containing protein [Sinorhizobium psoraleae]
MTGISLDHTVATIAAELPGAAELFRRHDISFCCGGNVRLSEAAVKSRPRSVGASFEIGGSRKGGRTRCPRRHIGPHRPYPRQVSPNAPCGAHLAHPARPEGGAGARSAPLGTDRPFPRHWNVCATNSRAT